MRTGSACTDERHGAFRARAPRAAPRLPDATVRPIGEACRPPSPPARHPFPPHPSSCRWPSRSSPPPRAPSRTAAEAGTPATRSGSSWPRNPPTLEPCEASLTDTGVVVRSNIGEPLIERDPATGEREPLLATAWRQRTPTTWELDLRPRRHLPRRDDHDLGGHRLLHPPGGELGPGLRRGRLRLRGRTPRTRGRRRAPPDGHDHRPRPDPAASAQLHRGRPPHHQHRGDGAGTGRDREPPTGRAGAGPGGGVGRVESCRVMVAPRAGRGGGPHTDCFGPWSLARRSARRRGQVSGRRPRRRWRPPRLLALLEVGRR